jgi:hypothetical protein
MSLAGVQAALAEGAAEAPAVAMAIAHKLATATAESNLATRLIISFLLLEDSCPLATLRWRWLQPKGTRSR